MELPGGWVYFKGRGGLQLPTNNCGRQNFPVGPRSEVGLEHFSKRIKDRRSLRRGLISCTGFKKPAWFGDYSRFFLNVARIVSRFESNVRGTRRGNMPPIPARVPFIWGTTIDTEMTTRQAEAIDMCCSLKDLLRRPVESRACDWLDNWQSKTERG